MKRSAITVVIPAFNCGQYLPVALASALRSPAEEILVAEHGSQDNTLEVAHHCRDRYPGRICVLETEERIPVVGVNLNRAFRHVRTPFVVRLDGDDILRTGHIRHAQARFAAESRLGVVSGLYSGIGPRDYLDPDGLPPDPEIDPERYRQLSGLDAARFVLGWVPPMASTGTVFRIAAWEDAGGFDESLTWGEDWELWFRVARRWEVGYFLSEIAYYRRNEGGLSSDHLRADRLCYQYDAVYRAARKVWPEPELRAAFRKAFLRSARTYCGSAVRALRRRRFTEVPARAMRGLAGLARAAAA